MKSRHERADGPGKGSKDKIPLLFSVYQSEILWDSIRIYFLRPGSAGELREENLEKCIKISIHSQQNLFLAFLLIYLHLSV